jgi:alkanesulfonate monooxygenase SsuD/methylene tetrahydromethanopterin reductase-like flavin-dependent oxidoreductase (luciferase family)
VAKALAGVQALGGVGVVLGVGIGEHEGEYAAARRPFVGRADRLERAVAEVRGHWTEGPERYRQRPVPPAVPIWFAGRTHPAIARAARLGDGWTPMLLSAAQYRRRVAWLDEELEAAGRPRAAVRRAVTTWVSVDDDLGRAVADGTAWLGSLFGRPAGAFARRLVAGGPAACAEAVAELRAAGAEHVILQVTADDPRPTLDRLLPALAPALGG